MDDELERQFTELSDTVMAPGIAATVAVRWLVAYLAQRGQAAELLASIEAEDWGHKNPRIEPVIAAMKSTLIEDLRQVIGGAKSE